MGNDIQVFLKGVMVYDGGATSPGPNPVPIPVPVPVPVPVPAPVPVGVQVVNIPWPQPGVSQTLPRPQLSNFGGQIFALKITCPSNIGTARMKGTIRIYEIPGALTTFREITIGDNPGDFTKGPFTYNGIGSLETEPMGSYQINDPQWRSHDGLFGFIPGQTIYVNVRNAQYQTGQGNFDMEVDFLTPTPA